MPVEKVKHIIRLYGKVNSTTHEIERLYGTIDKKSQPKY